MKTKIAPALADPAFAAATKRLAELKADRVQLRTDIDTLNQEALGSSGKSTPAERLHDKARALILGTSAAPSPSAAAERRRELLGEKYDRLAVIDEAIRLQGLAVEDALGPLSTKACEAARPAHVEAVKRIAAALVELDRANAAEHELRESLMEAGYRTVLMRAMPFMASGKMADVNSRTSYFLLEAFEHKFLAISDLPQHLHDLARARVAKPVKASPAPTKANADGWVGA